MTARKAVGRKERKDAKVQRRKGSGSRATIKNVPGYSPMRDGGLRGKVRFTHPTENMNAKTHPSPAGAQTQHPGGLGQVPRRWLRVKRSFAL